MRVISPLGQAILEPVIFELAVIWASCRGSQLPGAIAVSPTVFGNAAGLHASYVEAEYARRGLEIIQRTLMTLLSPVMKRPVALS